MNHLSVTARTMSSIEFLDTVINPSRQENGESTHEPRKFLAKVEDELDLNPSGKKFRINTNQTKSYYYELDKDQMLLVGMRESKFVRKKVLAILKSMDEPKIPQTYGEALQLAADQAKQLELAAPKIAVYEQLADRKQDINTTKLAKQLCTTATKLNKFLREKKIKMINNDLPLAGYMDWFNVVAVTRGDFEGQQCLITPHGQIEITKLWNEGE